MPAGRQDDLVWIAGRAGDARGWGFWIESAFKSVANGPNNGAEFVTLSTSDDDEGAVHAATSVLFSVVRETKRAVHPSGRNQRASVALIIR